MGPLCLFVDVDVMAAKATEAIHEIYKAIAKFKLIQQEAIIVTTETEDGEEKGNIEANTEKQTSQEAEEDKTKDKGVTAKDKVTEEVVSVGY